MNSKTIDKGNYKIYTYKTDKFKTIDLHVNYSFEASEDLYVISALKTLLNYTSKKYKNKIDKFIKGEELYDEDLYLSIDRDGRMVTFGLNASFINPKLVNDDFSEEAIKYPFDVFNNPVFDEKDLEYVKSSMKKNYARVNEQPANIADRNSKKNFYDDKTASSFFNVEDDIVDSLTMEQIKEKYEYIVNNSNISVFLLGDIEDKYIDYVDNNMIHKSVNKDINLIYINKQIDKPIEIVDTKKDIKQAQIVQLYDIDKMSQEEYQTMIMYALCLGSGMNSRLFEIVREKYQLCYNISSAAHRLNSFLRIETSVDNANIDKTMDAIQESIDAMDDINEDMLENKKKQLYKKYDNIFDSLDNIYDELFNTEILGLLSFEEKRKLVEKITLDEVKSMKDKYKIHTIYVLKGE